MKFCRVDGAPLRYIGVTAPSIKSQAVGGVGAVAASDHVKPWI